MSHLCIGTFLGTARTFFDSHICIDSKSHAFIGSFLITTRLFYSFLVTARFDDAAVSMCLAFPVPFAVSVENPVVASFAINFVVRAWFIVGIIWIWLAIHD